MTRDRPMALRREWWFTQLTLVVWGWMLVAPRLQDRWLVQLLLHAFPLGVVLTTFKVNPEWTRLRGAVLALWALALAGTAFGFMPLSAGGQRLAQGVESVSMLPLLAVLAAGILRFVYRSRRLTIDGIFATVLTYMIIAIAFAQLYLLLIGWDPQSFALPVPVEERSLPQLQADTVYYSLITQCSVGYGDILPRSETARALAVIQAVLGQFYMAVIVAVFVGMYASQRGD